MAFPQLIVAVYGFELFQGDSDQTARELAAIRESGFTVVNLFALHVAANGDLVYGDTVIVSHVSGTSVFSGQHLVEPVAELGDSAVVLFTIGGAEQSDFTNIQNLLAGTATRAAFVSNVEKLAAELPIDGFDLDCEEHGITVDTMADLTAILYNAAAGQPTPYSMFVTYCPYDNSAIWMDSLARVYAQHRTQLVSWMNLQCYDGGSANQPQDWAKIIRDRKDPLGIADANAFVVPGYWCIHKSDTNNCTEDPVRGALCPANLRQKFEDLRTADPGIRGGFVWSTSGIFNCERSQGCNGEEMTMAAYAQAIVEGLSDPA